MPELQSAASRDARRDPSYPAAGYTRQQLVVTAGRAKVNVDGVLSYPRPAALPPCARRPRRPRLLLVCGCRHRRAVSQHLISESEYRQSDRHSPSGWRRVAAHSRSLLSLCIAVSLAFGPWGRLCPAVAVARAAPSSPVRLGLSVAARCRGEHLDPAPLLLLGCGS